MLIGFHKNALLGQLHQRTRHGGHPESVPHTRLEPPDDKVERRASECPDLLPKSQHKLSRPATEVYGKDIHVSQLLKDEQVNSLLSSLGGALSIYIGLCLVVCVELLEIVLLLGFNIIRHFMGPKV